MLSIRSGILSVGVVSLSIMFMSAGWITDFSMAKQEAKKSNKLILLNFSGSDWCTPCIKTRKEIFEKKAFMEFANGNLVLINADFPRLKKHLLSKMQVSQNEALAEQYDKEGAFPFTLLMDADGKILKQWKGYPGVSAEAFISQIKDCEHQN